MPWRMSQISRACALRGSAPPRRLIATFPTLRARPEAPAPGRWQWTTGSFGPRGVQRRSPRAAQRPRCAVIADAEELGKRDHAAFAPDELAKNEQAMPVGRRLQEFAFATGRTVHAIGPELHIFKYANKCLAARSVAGPIAALRRSPECCGERSSPRSICASPKAALGRLRRERQTARPHVRLPSSSLGRCQRARA
jgi:hypothetical protein